MGGNLGRLPRGSSRAPPIRCRECRLVVNHASLNLNASAAAVNAADGTGTGGGTPTGGGTVTAARSLWSRVKGAAKWVKDHVVIGLHNIGYKGTF